MTVILLRHGETLGNRLGLILGQKDYPLTVSGIASTEKLAGVIAAEYVRTPVSDAVEGSSRPPKGIVFSSPLGRAKASAGIFAGRLGWQTIVLDGMAELACGAWEGQVRKHVAPDRPSIRASWTESPPGGESYESASARVKEAIDEIKSFKSAEVVLVVGHGSVNRLFLKIWLDLTPALAMTINQEHDAAYVLFQNKRIFRWVNAEGKSGQWQWPAECDQSGL
jgi:broad specificity phosphatase PhoE